MLLRTAITSLENLRQWWEVDNKSPYWTLYRGSRSSKGTDVIARNDTLDDHETSWDMLEQMISINSQEGGEFTILRTDKPKGNFGPKVVVILSHAPAYQGAPSVSGIPGLPFVAGSPQGIQAYIADEVKKERHSWELEKKVEDLEAAINAKQEGSLFERAINKLIETDKIGNLLEIIIAKAMGPTGAPQMSHVAVSGMPGASQADTPTNQFQYDTVRVANAMERIRVYFPDIHETLEKLANYIETNPEMAKTIFNQMK